MRSSLMNQTSYLIIGFLIIIIGLVLGLIMIFFALHDRTTRSEIFLRETIAEEQRHNDLLVHENRRLRMVASEFSSINFILAREGVFYDHVMKEKLPKGILPGHMKRAIAMIREKYRAIVT